MARSKSRSASSISVIHGEGRCGRRLRTSASSPIYSFPEGCARSSRLDERAHHGATSACPSLSTVASLQMARLQARLVVVRHAIRTTFSFGGAAYEAVFLANAETHFGRYHDRFGPYVRISGLLRSDHGERPRPTSHRGRASYTAGNELHGLGERTLIPKSAISLHQGPP